MRHFVTLSRVGTIIIIFNVCVIGSFIERKLCRSEASGSLRALPVPSRTFVTPDRHQIVLRENKSFYLHGLTVH